MDNQLRNDSSKALIIVLAVILGAVVGLGVFQAAAKGLIPLPQSLITSSPAITPQKTNTIVSEENAVINVVAKTSGSVVAIGAQQTVFNPFDPFSSSSSQDNTVGTGFVVSDKGIIVTNKHVVADPSASYSVVDKDGNKYTVTKIYRDPILDLALVQVSGSKLPALDLGDSSKLQVGQTVIAIGNALGRFTNTVTTGVVSGLGRRVVAGDPLSGSAESLDDLIQTDAAINPGNSGGPLLNSEGQVIGLDVATTEGAQNIGFAIPINSVKKTVDEFVTTGTVSRPFLGISYQFISRDVAIMNSVPQGAYVQNVITGSSAEKAGIKAGDIITKIDGQSIDSETTISQLVANKKIGDSLSIDLWNNGQTRTVTATLQNAPSQVNQ